MHKLKHSYLKRLIDADISNAELNIILYLCMHQDQEGKILGLHYKDVTEYIDRCDQTFYNVLDSLQEKGLISAEKKETGDYDVTVIGNDFSDGDYSCGYLSLRKAFLKTKIFKKLKAKAILLILELLYLCQCNKGRFIMGKDNFINTYAEKLHVKKRTIEHYLHSLRHYFMIKLEDKKYSFIPKNFTQRNIGTSDETFYNEYVVSVLARRRKIRKASEQEISETAKLIHQYERIAKDCGKSIWEVFQNCLEKSLEWLNKDKGIRERKKYCLEYKLIHRLIKESLWA